MPFSTAPYSGSSPMKPWPALAANAFCLVNNSGPEETIFYFDSAPPNAAAAISASRSSAPVFVLIHGLGDEADSWRHLIPLLAARGCRVLALDLPGFGRSAAPGRINLKRHVSAVLSLLEAARVSAENPAFIAGNSMGAVVAEAAAIRKPKLVKGLILIDGSIPGGPSNPGLFVLAKLLFSRKWYRAYREVPERARSSLYPYYADFDAMPPEDKDFLRERVMARVESSTQEQAFFATQRSLIRTHITASRYFARRMRKYPGKILLLWGDLDRIIPLATAGSFEALREDIELEIIPGAGHLPQQEKPGETARRMADFAERCIGC